MYHAGCWSIVHDIQIEIELDIIIVHEHEHTSAICITPSTTQLTASSYQHEACDSASVRCSIFFFVNGPLRWPLVLVVALGVATYHVPHTTIMHVFKVNLRMVHVRVHVYARVNLAAGSVAGSRIPITCAVAPRLVAGLSGVIDTSWFCNRGLRYTFAN